MTTNILVDTGGCASCGSGLSQAVAETDGSGKLTALYARAGDELLEVMRPGSSPGMWTTRFVHSDGLGSMRVLTDESGTTIDSRGYEAFGTKNVEAGNDPLTYGFAGEPFEGTSNLAYHRARWMDSRVGRFEGMDPKDGNIARPITWHRFLYAGANPINKTDPSGRDYDMASLGAGLEGSLILSTLATAAITQVGIEIVKGAKLYAENNKEADDAQQAIEEAQDEEDQGKQDKILSNGEIKKLQDAGLDVHDLKPDPPSRYDLYKKPNGDIVVKPKGGAGPGDPTGYNINDF